MIFIKWSENSTSYFYRMETWKRMFVNAILTIDAICLVGVIFTGYKYYFDNDGKGLDDLLFALCICALHSLFIAKAVLSYGKRVEKTKKWLAIGIVYLIFSVVYCLLEPLRYDIAIALFIHGVPLLLIFAAFLSIKKQQLFKRVNFLQLIVAVSIAGVPAYLLVFYFFCMILYLFYRG